MKLKKLLLPFATIASTVAVVMPITTSCGNGGNVNAQKVFDGEFKRSDDTVLGEDLWDEGDATSKYLSALKSNPKILSEDGFDFISTICSKSPIRFASVKGSLGFEPSDFIIDESQHDNPIYKASAKFKANITITDIKMPDLGELEDLLYDAKIRINGSAEFKNIRIHVGKAGEIPEHYGYTWGMRFDYDEETELEEFLKDNWSVECNLNINVSNFIGFSGNYNLNVKADKDSDITVVNSVRRMFKSGSGAQEFGLGSLQKIKINEDPE